MSLGRSKKNTQSSKTPLDAQKVSLVKEQERLKAEIQRNQKLIEEAPRLAEEARQKKRLQSIQAMSRVGSRGESPLAIRDPRQKLRADPSPARPLRRERSKEKYVFLFLCAALLACLYYLYFHFMASI